MGEAAFQDPPHPHFLYSNLGQLLLCCGMHQPVPTQLNGLSWWLWDPDPLTRLFLRKSVCHSIYPASHSNLFIAGTPWVPRFHSSSVIPTLRRFLQSNCCFPLASIRSLKHLPPPHPQQTYRRLLRVFREDLGSAKTRGDLWHIDISYGGAVGRLCIWSAFPAARCSLWTRLPQTHHLFLVPKNAWFSTWTFPASSN